MMNPAVAPQQPLQNPSTRRSISRSTAVNNNYISDCPPDNHSNSRTSSPSLGKRSVSLTTLQAATIFEPRMAQLETLEAKMASIEVSLSSTPRRKKNGSLNGLSLGGLSATSSASRSKELAAKELETLRNALRDKENIIQSLKGQLTVPAVAIRLNNNSLRNNNNNSNNNNNNNNNGNMQELTEVEKKQAEDRLSRLKSDVDNKRLAIKNLKIALERLDITDNIDIRIQQAELEYQLGREELNLLTLLEEMRALQLCIEESNRNSSESHTLFSCIKDCDYVILQAIEVVYDVKSPKFGAGPKENMPGLWVDWALDETGLVKEDRLVEVNGKIVLTKSRDDLNRLLAAAPDPAQLVVLRKCNVKSVKSNSSNEVSALRSELEVVRERAEEAQKIKDGLKSDNIRLTHRISYLEEQVSELLNRKNSERLSNVITSVKSNQNVTNITLSTAPTNGNALDKEMQVFQRGNQITALSLDGKDSKISLPVRSKSSLSNVSNTQITQEPHHCHKNHRHKHRLRSSLGNQSDNQSDYYNRKHHHHHHKDYNSETNSVDHHVNRQNKRNVEYHRLSDLKPEKDYLDQSYKKATKIVQDLTKNKDSLYEKHKQKCITASEKYNTDILKHYNARKSTSVLDFRSEIHIGPKYDSKSVEELDNGQNYENGNCTKPFKKIDLRSVKSLDFDSDCKSTDYASEPLESNNRKLYYNYGDVMKPSRPTPPKKPLRLSLHKTQSLQSVETPNNHLSSSHDLMKESRKRNHKGEIGVKLAEEYSHSNGQLKWIQYRKNEGSLEKSSWC